MLVIVCILCIGVKFLLFDEIMEGFVFVIVKVLGEVIMWLKV